jgi:hypothetical protein
LDVLDQRQLQALLLGGLAQDDGHTGQPSLAGSQQAALAGDQRELAGLRAARDDERLNDAVLADGGGQLSQLDRVKVRARLARVGGDAADGRSVTPPAGGWLAG